MALDARAQSLPFEIEILDEKYALWISNAEDRAVTPIDGRVQFFQSSRAHIHFK